MRGTGVLLAFATATIFSYTVARTAYAVDAFEIQVYEAEANEPMQAGIELHANSVVKGRAEPEYNGEVAPNGLSHMTLEPSFGITKSWELGGYLQLALDSTGRSYYGGFKLRSKFVVPREESGNYHWGINLELGRVPTRFEENGWASEVRPIAGYETGRWLFLVNPIVSWALAGEEVGVFPEFEPATKIRYNTGLGFGLGIEYYAALGRLDQVPGLRNQEHIAFLTGDLLNSATEFNIGVGRGLTAASNDWTVKMILGRAF